MKCRLLTNFILLIIKTSHLSFFHVIKVSLLDRSSSFPCLTCLIIFLLILIQNQKHIKKLSPFITFNFSLYPFTRLSKISFAHFKSFTIRYYYLLYSILMELSHLIFPLVGWLSDFISLQQDEKLTFPPVLKFQISYLICFIVGW